MEVFELRDKVVGDYSSYIRSFLTIKDARIEQLVREEMEAGFLWPEPLIQLNPSFEQGDTFKALADAGVVHRSCEKIFAIKSEQGKVLKSLRLHRHQVESIHAARAGDNYVLTTGTGSGKSLSYIVPIVDHVLRRGSGKGIQAIVVYPMNALANSQVGELEKFLCRGFPQGKPPVTFRRYTGQEREAERKEIIAEPPDVLLTNYVMLELLLTRPKDRRLIQAAKGLRFLVLDELHTYRGRQGADVAMLVRRVREGCEADELLHVGTSATLASGGSWEEQRKEVARVASLLFGDEVKPERIIGETLRRATAEFDPNDTAFIDSLRLRLESGEAPDPEDTERFLADPVSRWIESMLGLQREPETGRLVRSTPTALTGQAGAAVVLAEQTGVALGTCESALRRALLDGYRCLDENGRSLFAFRLHQFVSKGESVYASPEAEGDRHITLQPQQFVPGSGRQRALLPLVFCRECGQEYYSVRRKVHEGQTCYLPREISDRLDDDDGDAGFLYLSTKSPWPDKASEFIVKLPDSWLTTRNGQTIIRRSQRKYLPDKVFMTPAAEEDGGTQAVWWLRTPFRFCLECGITYGARQRSDYGKLATLGSEGRSTATTILSLSTIRKLRREATLEPKARKLLSFTDNRQDASLQAGHFNDFVEIALLRSAIWRAAEKTGADGLRHDKLTLRVFDALDLPLEVYATDPGVKYLAREETDRALREALGYFIYRDLRRGWRVTSPNLEQCGLLEIDYLSLKQFCTDEDEWKDRHPIFATATPEQRSEACRALLDHMRRELAVKVSYLDPVEQESLRQLSRQRLISPWAIDDQEKLERSSVVFPCSQKSMGREVGHFSFLSPRGGFALFLKRRGTFPNFSETMKTEEVELVIRELCQLLTVPGLLQQVVEPRDDDGAPGYQINAAALIWKPGTGQKAFHDPIRVPRAPEGGLRPNPFFKEFYRSQTQDLKRLEAREHTAQVTPQLREEREKKFRQAHLPILYCSPTMELGVDIAQLNVVNMRNIPPTPANYAQRSGRAGRSGQPAFVFSYCSSGSPHDQYFFKRPRLMVAGAVSPPRLDLGNEDLLKAHVHAVWLGVSGLSLGQSLRDILEVIGDDPTLQLQPHVAEALGSEYTREKAHEAARIALDEAIRELVGVAGDPDAWLDRILRRVPDSFENACKRWKGLYRSALSQSKRQQRIILDPSRDPRDRESAKRLRYEAEAQLRLLLEMSESQYSDFYSYRYFASEGFLPGYNFPRLPLSAFLPGRKSKRGSDEFLTRPRFLAVSEFGPRAFIYHEGSRYVINKVILPVEEGGTLKRRAVQCEACGYLHPLRDEPGPDLCESCNTPLPQPYANLFRMENVSTRRRDRINSDEEERFRMGYEIKSGLRFARREGRVSSRSATVLDAEGSELLTLVYGHAATLWRMNLGWRRRSNKDQVGFVLDVERGYWARNQAVDDDPEDPLSPRTERLIPYVEDTRNCILVRPSSHFSETVMASLQAALKVAVQVHFQLEDRELATEPLPAMDDRRQILIYEASEGGAGVLRRLVEDVQALPTIARMALEICHYDPDTGEDRKRPPGAKEDCEAGCYDCLLSYYNQRDHRYIDRSSLLELLRKLTQAQVRTSPAPRRREEEVERLLNQCQSELERTWVRFIDVKGLSLPGVAQKLIEACKVSADFVYQDEKAAVFVDGPVHDTPARQSLDEQQQESLEDFGWTVIRFRHDKDWGEVVQRFPSLFGRPREGVRATTTEADVVAELEFDPDDYDDTWQNPLKTLAELDGILVEPGDEVMAAGRVVDLTVACIRKGERSLDLIDAEGESASQLMAALKAAGRRAISLRPTEDGLVEKILESLEADV